MRYWIGPINYHGRPPTAIMAEGESHDHTLIVLHGCDEIFFLFKKKKSFYSLVRAIQLTTSSMIMIVESLPLDNWSSLERQQEKQGH